MTVVAALILGLVISALIVGAILSWKPCSMFKGYQYRRQSNERQFEQNKDLKKFEEFSYPKHLITEETYSEDGKIKYSKQYEKGQLTNISFYAYSIDEIEEILKEKRGNTSITFIYFKNSYKITEHLVYIENKLMGKMITVIDKNESPICFKKYELKESKLVCMITEKSYYENGEEKFAFDYKEDGSCFMIDRVGTYHDDIFAWDIGTAKTDFTWDGFEYYKNVEPLIP